MVAVEYRMLTVVTEEEEWRTAVLTVAVVVKECWVTAD
jgi:hypothetical protein